MISLLQRHAWLLPLLFAAVLGATSLVAFRSLERAEALLDTPASPRRREDPS